MKTFHCNHCGHLLFFENTVCVKCGHQVAYLPDVGLLGSLDPVGDGTWRSPGKDTKNRAYRLCENYSAHQICNWAVVLDDPHALCMSCRLTQVIPDLSQDGFAQSWYRLEVAKRRVIFTLMQFSLPLKSREEDPQHGLAFEFKCSPPDENPVLTGHANGVITINIAEADDVERERQRQTVQEPYRTVLGHVRHEIGHYYWEQLIADSSDLENFRERFGDERTDYQAALQDHYQQGPRSDWPEGFVSAYASAHPWEDWAETWAHYLHMVDTMETAAACGMSLRPQRAGEPAMSTPPSEVTSGHRAFQSLIDRWFPLTYALNNFNRGLGLPDAYPFVLSPKAIAKLEYVHDVIHRRTG